DLRPGSAAVRGLVEPAVGRVRPQGAGRAHVDDVAVLRMDDDADDTLAVGQAYVGPGLAAIGRLVDAIAYGDRVACPALARADPHDLLVGRIERDRADGLHRFMVEHRLEIRAAVF